MSSELTAEENLTQVADALDCHRSSDKVRTALSNLPPTKQWLLILDNADSLNPLEAYQRYLPTGNRGAIIMTSRNPQCGWLAVPGGHEELDNLSEAHCVELFRKASQYARQPPATEDDAVTLVKELGYHTLAVLHAASYISSSHCTTAEYLESWQKSRRKILASSGETSTSSDNVHATFEASMEFLESSQVEVPRRKCQDALQLLQILSMFHYESIPLDILTDACRGAKKALKTPKTRLKDTSSLTSWHVSQIPELFLAEIEDAKHRMTEAVTLLESLALASMDASVGPHVWKSVSMHPLIHGWTRSRQIKNCKNSLRMNECIVALARFANRSSWAPYHSRFGAHLRPLIELDEHLVAHAAKSRRILQMCVQIAFTYHRVGLFRDMHELTSQIFHRMGLQYDKPTRELRHFYVVCATAISAGGRPGERSKVVQVYEAIVRQDERLRGETEGRRLQRIRWLGAAYLENDQAQGAVTLFRKQVKVLQKHGKGGPKLRRVQQDLAIALSQNDEAEEALELFEEIAKAEEGLDMEERPSQLRPQHALAVAYLETGQTNEAMTRLEESVRRHVRFFGENHDYTAIAQRWLAVAYLRKGMLVEAIDLLERVVAVRGALYDEGDPRKEIPQKMLPEACGERDGSSLSPGKRLWEGSQRIHV